MSRPRNKGSKTISHITYNPLRIREIIFIFNVE